MASRHCTSEILVPPHIAHLHPYEPGLNPEDVKRRFGITKVVKLASNENPFGTSPSALKFAREALAGMSRYPAGSIVLREKLADMFGVRLENVIAGAGSDSIMANIVRTFLCDDDEILTTEAAFQGFQVIAQGRGVAYRTVPYKDWQYDLCALAASITPRTKLIYLANPNNPTGSFFTRRQFEDFHRQVPQRVLIILDEAYFEYAMGQPLYPDSMHYRFDNVITLRTFSKAYGLASARVGYGFAHEDLIAVLLKVKLPFELSGIAEAAALGALDDREFMLHTVANNANGLGFLTRSLRAAHIQAVSSSANFVMLAFGSAQQASAIFQALLQCGVIVRPLAATGLPSCLRVSVGTPQDNEVFIESFQRVTREFEVSSYASVD